MILWSARDANKVEKCSSLTKIALTNEYMIRHFRRRIKAVNYSTDIRKTYIIVSNISF